MKHFAALQNAVALRNLFQDQLPGFAEGRLRITACDVDYRLLKQSYKPGFQHKATLGIGCRLHVADQAAQIHGYLRLYGKAYLCGRSTKAYSALPTTHHAPPSFGLPLVHLPDADMIVWAFPNDPRLTSLPRLFDLPQVRKLLVDDAPPARPWLTTAPVAGLTATVVRYKPELRCTIRYERADGLLHNQPSLYAKTVCHDDIQDIYQYTQYFSEESSKSSQNFFVARPCAFNKELRVMWQDGIAGVSVLHMINHGNARELLSTIAGKLALFHRTNLTVPLNVRFGDRLKEARKRVGKIGQALPAYHDTLQDCLTQLEQQAAQFSVCPDVLIHGDFHLEQLALYDSNIALFDFDDIARGDPLQDVANFIAQLHFYEFAPDFVRLMSESFLRAYANAVEWDVSLDRVAWHMRIQCIRKACRMLLQQQPDAMAPFLEWARYGVPLDRTHANGLSPSHITGQDART